MWDYVGAQPQLNSCGCNLLRSHMDWAAPVKGGHIYWLHFDGLKDVLQDKVHLKGFGKWARWQQRRGLFWSLALPRWSEWLTNVTVRSLAVLPAVHRIRGKDAIIPTYAP